MPSTSQAMPCLAGFQFHGNTPWGLLNHSLPAAVILNLPVAILEVGSHQVGL